VVEVTVERAGQLVTVAAHDVMVTTSVTKVVLSAITAPTKRAATTAKRILIDLGVSGKISRKVGIKVWRWKVEADELFDSWIL